MDGFVSFPERKPLESATERLQSEIEKHLNAYTKLQGLNETLSMSPLFLRKMASKVDLDAAEPDRGMDEAMLDSLMQD